MKIKRANMESKLFNRSMEILKNEGILAYLRALGRYLFIHHPIGDMLWLQLNYCLHPSRKIIKEIQGSKMMLDLSDKGINRDLFLRGCRKPGCTQTLKKVLTNGMQVVDIGANIGYYALLSARLVGNTGRVYAIEPDTKNFELLRRNVQLNSLSERLELHNLAIGNYIGDSLLEISDQFNLHKIMLEKPGDKSKKNYIKVQMVTLDHFCENKHVDFVRMDVEGFEYYILQGMHHILQERDLKLFIEVHPDRINEMGKSVEEMLRVLVELNYAVSYLVIKERKPSSLRRCIFGDPNPPERVIECNQPLEQVITSEATRQFLLAPRAYGLFLKRI